MTPASYFLVLFLLSHPLLLHSAEEEEEKQSDDIKCPPFYCKNLNYTHGYGWLTVDNCSKLIQKIQLESGGEWYDVVNISPAANIRIHNQSWLSHYFSDSCTCKSSKNFLSPSISFNTTSNLTQSQCYHTPHTYFSYISSGACAWYNISHGHLQIRPPLPLPQCSTIQTPMSLTQINDHLFSLPAADIFFQVRLSDFCFKCYYNGSECYMDSQGNFQCVKAKERHEGNNKLRLKVGLALGIGFLAALIICFLVFFIRRCHYKQKHRSSDFLMSNISADAASKSDLDRSVVYFGVPIFSYSELEEATNNFDPTKKLGDGGFGTVYHGKLQDGREVAVKRLYENSNKQVEQFMNEVEILTCLRHKNLVSLYGCTSCHSRELLLVYEFIPNGTIADHLYGDRVKPGSLTWPIRMSIAIETAEALAYLHANDIIHRDVKTNNILLDSNFCVKVADFGLSRLFPIDCTHVSTAPQGTPGYLDPEYHQCYQLSDKSDVYSFGVVLIELISSMPAVDMSRNRHEINLANFAMKRIQNCAFDELVDPCLGFESNLMVRRMSTSVAELAFQCLQQDKEMRPSMDEVLEVLKGIESEEYEAEDDVGLLKKTIRPPTSPDSDHVRLLKNMQLLPSSPNSVTEKWVSRSTTPSASAEAFPQSA